MSVCVLLEKYIPSCCVRNNKVKESSTSLGSLEMDIVKMSPLAAVLPEEEEEGEEKEKEKKEKKKKERRKKMLTLIPSAARLCSFVFFLLFLSCCMHGNNERAKTSSQRTSFDDAFRQRASVRFSFFFVLCAQAYVNTYFFFSYIYFFAHCLHGALQKQRSATSRSPLFLHIYATEVIASFFLTRTIRLTAKVYNKQCMALKKKTRKKKKRFDLRYIHNTMR